MPHTIYDPTQLTNPPSGRARFQQASNFFILDSLDYGKHCDSDVSDKHYSNYYEHVKTRAFLFINCLFIVMKLIQRLGLNGPYGDELYMSDIATIQANLGIRVIKNDMGLPVKIDAAHYVNTTILCAKFETKFLSQYGRPLTAEFRTLVLQFAMLSGQTSHQLQAANVGPDKVIDSSMTLLKKQILSSFNPPALPRVKSVMNDYLNIVTNALSTKATEKYPIGFSHCETENMSERDTRSCILYRTALKATKSAFHNNYLFDNLTFYLRKDYEAIDSTPF